MRKRLIIMVMAILLLVVVAIGVKVLIIKRMMARFQPPPPPTVSVQTAVSKTWHPSLSAVGTLVAVFGVDVSAEVSGMVDHINFDSGQLVEKGQSLLQLDDAIDQQDVRNNQAQLILDQKSYDRQKNLYATKAVSRDQLDMVAAKLEQSKAMLKKSEVVLGQKQVKAPFAGKLGIRRVDLGQYLSPGQPIVSLQSLDPLYVNFSLPEQETAQLKLGMKVIVKVDAYPDRSFVGKVTAISSKIAEQSRTIDAQATINNPNHLLYPGGFADVRLELPQQQDVVTVPQTAINYALYGDSIYVVKSAEKDKQGNSSDQVQQVFVKLGDRQGDVVAVLQGIHPGDRVVTSGQLKLHDKMPVQIERAGEKIEATQKTSP